jgi:hypothetical protein
MESKDMDIVLLIAAVLAAIGVLGYWKLARTPPEGGRCEQCDHEMIYVTDLPPVVGVASRLARKPSAIDGRYVALFFCPRCGTRKSVEY